eukprot:EG_transcript_1449
MQVATSAGYHGSAAPNDRLATTTAAHPSDAHALPRRTSYPIGAGHSWASPPAASPDPPPDYVIVPQLTGPSMVAVLSPPVTHLLGPAKAQMAPPAPSSLSASSRRRSSDASRKPRAKAAKAKPGPGDATGRPPAAADGLAAASRPGKAGRRAGPTPGAVLPVSRELEVDAHVSAAYGGVGLAQPRRSSLTPGPQQRLRRPSAPADRRSHSNPARYGSPTGSPPLPAADPRYRAPSPVYQVAIPDDVPMLRAVAPVSPYRQPPRRPPDLPPQGSYIVALPPRGPPQPGHPMPPPGQPVAAPEAGAPPVAVRYPSPYPALLPPNDARAASPYALPPGESVTFDAAPPPGYPVRCVCPTVPLPSCPLHGASQHALGYEEAVRAARRAVARSPLPGDAGAAVGLPPQVSPRILGVTTNLHYVPVEIQYEVESSDASVQQGSPEGTGNGVGHLRAARMEPTYVYSSILEPSLRSPAPPVRPTYTHHTTPDRPEAFQGPAALMFRLNGAFVDSNYESASEGEEEKGTPPAGLRIADPSPMSSVVDVLEDPPGSRDPQEQPRRPSFDPLQDIRPVLQLEQRSPLRNFTIHTTLRTSPARQPSPGSTAPDRGAEGRAGLQYFGPAHGSTFPLAPPRQVTALGEGTKSIRASVITALDDEAPPAAHPPPSVGHGSEPEGPQERHSQRASLFEEARPREVVRVYPGEEHPPAHQSLAAGTDVVSSHALRHSHSLDNSEDSVEDDICVMVDLQGEPVHDVDGYPVLAEVEPGIAPMPGAVVVSVQNLMPQMILRFPDGEPVRDARGRSITKELAQELARHSARSVVAGGRWLEAQPPPAAPAVPANGSAFRDATGKGPAPPWRQATDVDGESADASSPNVPVVVRYVTGPMPRPTTDMVSREPQPD